MNMKSPLEIQVSGQPVQTLEAPLAAHQLEAKMSELKQHLAATERHVV